MADPKWNNECTEFDARPDDAPDAPLAYYERFCTVLGKHGIQTGDIAGTRSTIIDIMHEYLYIKMGRRRWFVSQEMFETINSLQIDDKKLNFNEIQVPYDSMAFVMERGCELEGLPFRFMVFSYPRSEIAFGILNDFACDLSGFNGVVSTLVDFGMSGILGPDGKCIADFDQDRPATDAILVGAGSEASCPVMEGRFDASNGKNIVGEKAFNAANRFAAKALLLYNARPEFVAPFELSRTQRYEFGNAATRKNIHRVMFPDKKIIRPNGRGSVPSGKQQPYHIRGWSLRTLRDERFARNPDGTLKTILVAPYEVHAELKPD